ncbi:13836_t:CDS:2 [Dentiscutata heterogama]|uniref:13836_t:CDS:1 n=1 Tax=Dentiscutata heterogama TaxID=1316150 RepID=A0ACA9K161_9GLOM|nr:13836_t:CDS:2 [Dentiscutata heterogama]
MADPNYIYEPKRKNIKNEVHKTVSQIPQFSIEYVKSLFPIFSWIGRYNTTWFISDLIAGITVGLVVIPQSMAYAKVATLPVQYGLYTSFVGVIVYCLFATSKDMTIGPTAVVSLLTGQTLSTILKDNKDFTNTRIAATFSLLTGLIILLIGLLRIGYIVKYVSNPVAGLLGITNVNTRDPTYLVLGNTLRNLGHTTIDASVGLTCLLLLYTIKFGMSYLSGRFPNSQKIFFFTSTLRNFLVVVLYTLIAYLLNIGKSTNPLNILKTVPSGLNDVGVKELNSEILGICAPYLPGICVVLILEHIAIAQSFGRINDYKGSFFSAYPATGSFSRSAVKAKSGVRTPLAGIFSGILVILALYALTPVFYYIPNSALSVEIGIYASVGFSLAITLIQLSRPQFETIGRIAIASFNGVTSKKYAYVPLKAPFDEAQSPPSGILIFRLDRMFTYPNADYVEGQIINYVKENTRRVTELPKNANELPWNEARDIFDKEITKNSELPPLKAIIFDFSAVHIVDSTAVQTLIDAKKTIKRHAGSDVEYHFANILNESIQRSLIIAGFGSADQKASLIDIGTNTTENNDLESKKSQETKISSELKKSEEISEIVIDNNDTSTISKGKKFFHISLEEAVIAATNGNW